MKLSELATKDVINENDGTKLGKIVDLEIEIATGKISYVTIHRGLRLVNLLTNKDTTQIPWHKIIKIGSDVIIVESDIRKLKNKTDDDKKDIIEE